MKLKLFTLFAIFFLMIIGSSIPVSSAEDSSSSYPLLTLAKIVDKKIIHTEDSIVISFRITNIGNDTAYNVTLIDNRIPEWVGEVIGNTTANWAEIGANQTVYYQYEIKVKDIVLTNITLGEAKVIYYDARGNKYVVYSNTEAVDVELPTGVEVNWEDLWRNVIILEGSLVAAIVILLMIFEYKAYRDYIKTSKKTK